VCTGQQDFALHTLIHTFALESQSQHLGLWGYSIFKHPCGVSAPLFLLLIRQYLT
jgi:hypothetical protein